MASFAFSQASLFSFSAWLIALYADSSTDFQRQAKESSLKLSIFGHMAVVLYQLVTTAATGIFLISLAGFHVFLRMKKLTTYEYITKMRDNRVTNCIVDNVNIRETSATHQEQTLFNQLYPEIAQLANAVNEFNLAQGEVER